MRSEAHQEDKFLAYFCFAFDATNEQAKDCRDCVNDCSGMLSRMYLRCPNSGPDPAQSRQSLNFLLCASFLSLTVSSVILSRSATLRY